MTTRKPSVARATQVKPPRKHAGTAVVAKPARKAAPETSLDAAPELAVKKAKKEHVEKVVRDSFTMPQSEYRKIAEIKETCLKAGFHVKKSEVLRAGLKVLCEMTATQMKKSLKGVEKIRTGRPKKHKD